MVWRWGAVVTGARARLTGAGTGGGAVVTGTRPRLTGAGTGGGAVVTGTRPRQTDAGTGGGAVVTGTRPRQTETPCPSARNGVALWSRPILVQLEGSASRYLTHSPGSATARYLCVVLTCAGARRQGGCAGPAFLCAGTAHSPAGAHPRPCRPARPAVRMASSGADFPVMSSTCSAA